MLVSIQELEQRFSRQLIEEGRKLNEKGAIDRVNLARSGELITAIVGDENNKPLRVYIRIGKENGSREIHGECSCGAQMPCAHVVGVLIHTLQDKHDTGEDRPTQSGIDTRQVKTEPPPQQLHYTLHFDNGRLKIGTYVVRHLSQGGLEQISYFEPARASGATPARFLAPLDLELLQALASAPLDPASLLPLLEGAGSSRLFEKMIATQRCHFTAFEGNPPLRPGTPRRAELYWQTDPFGRQRLAWRASPPASILLPFDSPWYLDPERSDSAPLLCEFPDSQFWELLQLSPITADLVEEWWKSFQNNHPKTALPAPRIYQIETLPPATPQPCLCLNGAQGDSKKRPYARLTFYYGDIELAPGSPDTTLHDGHLIRITRDRATEQASMTQLCDLGFESNGGSALESECFLPRITFPQTLEQAWLACQMHALPRLRELGWRITFNHFPHRLVETKRWRVHIDRLEPKDWFALSLELEVEGRQISLLPLLLKLLKSLPPQRQEMEQVIGQDLLLSLEDIDGNPCQLRLPGARAVQILELLLEVCGSSHFSTDGPIEINRAHLARLAALDADPADCLAPIYWDDEESQQLAERLRTLEQIPSCAPPNSLQASLRPYQQQGLEWLQFLREFSLAGILADDMGLGKTLQTLAHLLLEKEANRADLPSLVVVPTSLTFNWLHETRRFAPDLKLLLLHGAQRKKRLKQLHDYDLIITTYPLLTRDSVTLEAQEYHLLILDEAQTIKNPKTQASQIVRRLQARHRLCLTGTPMENHLGELWSLFDFLMPGLLGSERDFRRDYRTPIEAHNDEATSSRLSQRLRPFLLRRTKQQVAQELPEKNEIIQSVTLEGAQRELYETLRLSMHRRVREEIERMGLARSHIIVLDALTKLRQVCCDPRLLKHEKMDPPPSSAKLQQLMSLLEEMIEEGRRILLFSQFTTMLSLIEAEVRKSGISYVKLTGQTRDRETQVKQFQEGKVPLFLISLKAGGVGLNLTAADTVIHYDPWWNPAVERQATDRSHRIGQTQKVFVYKLICEGTLEEKILAMQQRKQRLADGLYQSDNVEGPQWNEEDIDALFGPLQDEETT